MTFARTLVLCLAVLGCDHRRPKVPDWVLSAPPAAVMALSCRAGWALEPPRLLDLLRTFPLAQRSLDLFLQRARLDLRQETGRVTVFFTRPEPAGSGQQGFLIQLGSFRDPGRLQVAVANAFPVEGALSMNNRDYPLFVITDDQPIHIRAMADGEGRIWVGDLAALAGLGARSGSTPPALAASAEWISEAAAVQGFILPQELRDDTAPRLPGELARNLPRGIESVSWGLSPAAAPETVHGFELALAGSPEAVERASSWMHRFLEAASVVPGTPGAAPEILQESHRIGLRCRLTQDQVDMAMVKLGQLPIRCQ